MSVLRRPIPDKTVVLTFDDGSKSQLTVAGPLLQELGFGGTFFITEVRHFRTCTTVSQIWGQLRRRDDAACASLIDDP